MNIADELAVWLKEHHVKLYLHYTGCGDAEIGLEGDQLEGSYVVLGDYFPED